MSLGGYDDSDNDIAMHKAITKALNEYGILTVVSGGNARCDMAAFLYRLAGSPVFEPSTAGRARFSDVTAATPHAKEIWWLAHTRISTGFDDGTFRPYSSVARCDMAAFLRRMNDAGLV